VSSRGLMVGIIFAAALAVITGSVLVLGYVIAGASLLLMSALVIRRLVGHRRTPRLRPSYTRWLDASDREAA
jgi:hypothetical protein